MSGDIAIEWRAASEWLRSTQDVDTLRAVAILLFESGYRCHRAGGKGCGGTPDRPCSYARPTKRNPRGKECACNIWYCDFHSKPWPCVDGTMAEMLGLVRDFRWMADEAPKGPDTIP